MPGLNLSSSPWSAPPRDRLSKSDLYFAQNISIDEEYLYNVNYLLNNIDDELRAFKCSNLSVLTSTTNSSIPSAANSSCDSPVSNDSSVRTSPSHRSIYLNSINNNNSNKDDNIPQKSVIKLAEDFEFRRRSLHEKENALTNSLVFCNKSSSFRLPTCTNNNINSKNAGSLAKSQLTRGVTVSQFDSRSSEEMQSGSESCYGCSKRVYPLDRVSTGDRVYHKPCFRCSVCNRVLLPGNFAQLDGTIMCKPHYIEKFRRRGKYEVQQRPTAPAVESVTKSALPEPTPATE